jgi:hypothetical protein
LAGHEEDVTSLKLSRFCSAASVSSGVSQNTISTAAIPPRRRGSKSSPR